MSIADPHGQRSALPEAELVEMVNRTFNGDIVVSRTAGGDIDRSALTYAAKVPGVLQQSNDFYADSPDTKEHRHRVEERLKHLREDLLHCIRSVLKGGTLQFEWQ